MLRMASSMLPPRQLATTNLTTKEVLDCDWDWVYNWDIVEWYNMCAWHHPPGHKASQAEQQIVPVHSYSSFALLVMWDLPWSPCLKQPPGHGAL